MSWAAIHLLWAGCGLLALLGIGVLAGTSRRHRGFDDAARAFLDDDAPVQAPGARGERSHV
jgi:hypothetical protein